MGRTDLYDPRELGRLRPEKRGAHAAVQAVAAHDEARARGVPIREVHLDFFFSSFVFFFIFLVVVFSLLSESFSTFKFFPVFFDSTRTLDFICCSSICTMACPLNWLADAATDLTQAIDRPSPVHHDARSAHATTCRWSASRLAVRYPSPSPSPSPSRRPSAPSAPACAGRCVYARGTAGCCCGCFCF